MGREGAPYQGISTIDAQVCYRKIWHISGSDWVFGNGQTGVEMCLFFRRQVFLDLRLGNRPGEAIITVITIMTESSQS